MSTQVLSARITFTPWVHPDGQTQHGSEDIKEPLSVEIDGAWVHVVRYGSLGARKVVRSYPSHEIASIAWGSGAS